MGNKGEDFNILNDAQGARDSYMVNKIRDDLIAPLVCELEAAIPGYKAMGNESRFAALMKLNEEHAPNGYSLVLDFGMSDNGTRLRSAVYSGRNDLHLYSERDGYKIYDPWFLESFGGVPGSIASNIEYLLFPPHGHDHGFRSVYDGLPLPFKIAVSAQYIKQNVVTTTPKACQFAAGWVSAIEPSRFVCVPMEGTSLQRFGWLIALRDTKPQNEMGIHIAKALRSYTDSAAQQFPGWPVDGELVPLFAAEQTRTWHKSTELLVDFVERVLPSMGLYMGRSGKGKRISIKKAYSMFDELHPGLYKSPKTFYNSYLNARKAREGR